MKARNPIALMVLGKGKPAGGAPDGDEPAGAGEESDTGLEAAAEELISAVEAKDPKAVAAALKSAYAQCSSSED